MQQDKKLQTLFEAFALKVEEYINEEVNRRSELKKDSVVVTNPTNSTFQNLEKVLFDFKSNDRKENVEQRIDGLLSVLEKSVMSDSKQNDSFDILHSFSENVREKNKTERVDFYLDKLTNLYSNTPQQISITSVTKKNTGIGYAMDLLRQYKSKFIK